MKNWGRVKIKYELKKNKVSDYCIKKALAQIDEMDYLKTAKKLIVYKQNALKCLNSCFFSKDFAVFCLNLQDLNKTDFKSAH
mgnify:CR=1 FL=1